MAAGTELDRWAAAGAAAAGRRTTASAAAAAALALAFALGVAVGRRQGAQACAAASETSPAPAAAPAGALAAAAGAGEGTPTFSLQVGAYPSAPEAEAYAAALSRKGHAAHVVAAELPDRGGTWYRVRLGAYATYEAALKAKAGLADDNIPAWVVQADD